MQRILETETIRIGFNATFFGFFNVFGFDGEYTGFDQDLSDWIAKKIEKKLALSNAKNIEIDRIEYAWEKILPTVRDFEVDFVISSMTKMRKREQDNPGVKFSESYLSVNQIFISNNNKNKEFPAALKNSNVGVQRDTFNSKAAKTISERFGFNVVELDYYADVYREIGSGVIDFGLVDDVLVGPRLDTEFFRYGPFLNKYLGDLYTLELGYDSEEYAIAVRDKELLIIINEILKLEETKDYIDSLKEEWVKPQKLSEKLLKHDFAPK